ncbi:MAG: hypothetical protein IPM55_15360 [Acidobacteria bacterium]|nr:hypothetical protein [Acidobacteriota bacterium]
MLKLNRVALIGLIMCSVLSIGGILATSHSPINTKIFQPSYSDFSSFPKDRMNSTFDPTIIEPDIWITFTGLLVWRFNEKEIHIGVPIQNTGHCLEINIWEKSRYASAFVIKDTIHLPAGGSLPRDIRLDVNPGLRGIDLRRVQGDFRRNGMTYSGNRYDIRWAIDIFGDDFHRNLVGTANVNWSLLRSIIINEGTLFSDTLSDPRNPLVRTGGGNPTRLLYAAADKIGIGIKLSGRVATFGLGPGVFHFDKIDLESPSKYKIEIINHPCLTLVSE